VRLLAALTVATGVVFAAGCATAARGSARPAAGAPAAPPAEQTAAPATAPGPEQAVKTSPPRTIEQQDPQLGAALKELAVLPTPERLRQVAERYRTLGILDAAFEHYRRATVLDARDGAAYEGLARVWRDWGFPDIALSAAHRAVFIAPDSASVHNTLGTVLQALGQFENAAAEYEQASRLDPRAAYAVSNLCYLSFLDGRFEQAVATCRSALAVDPAFLAARNNLALAHAAAGQLDLARTEFLDAGGGAQASFNMGIVYMAGRDYARAEAAFDDASNADPTMTIARVRAADARRLAGIAAREAAGESK